MKFLLFSTCKFLTRFDISVTKNADFLEKMKICDFLALSGEVWVLKV